MTLTKAEQPHFLDLGPVDVGDLLADLQARLPTLGDRAWTIDAPDAPGRTGHPPRMPGGYPQAMLNLVVNAVQHTEPRRRVGISPARVDNGSLLLLGARHRTRRGPRCGPPVCSKRFPPGGPPAALVALMAVGIGLSIVAAIATPRWPTDELDNRLGEGAMFVLEIPIEQRPVHPPPR